jgi:hypothetical protein
MRWHTAVRGWTRQGKWKKGDPVRSIIACKADMELIVDVADFSSVFGLRNVQAFESIIVYRWCTCRPFLSSTFGYLHEILNASMEARDPDERPIMLPCWLEAKKTFDANLEAEGFARHDSRMCAEAWDPFEE